MPPPPLGRVSLAVGHPETNYGAIPFEAGLSLRLGFPSVVDEHARF